MTTARRMSILAIGLIGLVVSAAHAVDLSADARLLAKEAAGLVPVDDERRVEIAGLEGEIVLQLGKPGELRFLSARRGGKKEEIPVALWLDRGTFHFRPLEGQGAEPRLMQVSIPPGPAVRVTLPKGGLVGASGLRGPLEVQGAGVLVDARGLQDAIELDLEGGSVVIQTAGGDVRLRGGSYNATVDGAQGSVSADLVGGTLTARRVAGFDGRFDGTAVIVDTATGFLRLDASGGRATLTALQAGGEIELIGTPLGLVKGKGDITVTSDSDVQFQDMEADLHFDVYGGSVRGSGNKGIFEARTRNATVTIEKIDGGVRVQGDGLQVKISNVGGETLVYAGRSDIELENVGGPVTVENRGGDVRATQIGKELTVKGDGGSVQLRDLTSPVTAEVDGPILDVAWASLSGEKDSVLKNAGGEVAVHFPGGTTGCRISATSSFGRVESDVPRVIVADDGKSAQGQVGGASRPWVRIEAEGDVRILQGGSPETPASE